MKFARWAQYALLVLSETCYTDTLFLCAPVAQLDRAPAF